MPLEGNVKPALTWDPLDKTSVALVIVCHCGEQFGIDDLDAAQVHVKGHATDVDEPS